MFALHNSLASNNSLPRWDPRARIGLNLGPSPTHTRNVHLVLSLTTGLVLPQFHCCFDNFFETCKYGVTDGGLSSTWQCLAGFNRANGEPILHTGDGLLGQMDSHICAAPQATVEQESFSLPEILDAGSVTSQFYEDGSVNFSDTPPHVTCQSSHAGRHTSDVTCQASQQPDQPPPAQWNRRTPRNRPANTSPPSTSTPDAGTSSCGCICTMTCAMAESIDQKYFFGSSDMHYMSAHATTACNSDDQTYEDSQHDEHLSFQDCMSHPIAFHAEMMGNIMYLNQTLQQPDTNQFMEAVIAEVNGHVDNKHWQLTKRSEVPPNTDVLPSVWLMRRKRDITTNDIKKYKARLNLHGGKQEFGTNYYETYAPVATWFSICLLIVIGIIFGWALC